MARTTRGRVYKRGKDGREVPRGKERTTPGKWYAEYYHGGKRSRVSLDKKRNKKVTTREEAEAVLADLVNPYIARDEAERTRRAYSAITAAEEAALAAKAERERIPLDEAWERFPLTENVRGRSRRTLSAEGIKDNKRCWDRLVAFLCKEFPDLAYVQDISPEHAMAFSKHLRPGCKLSAHRHNVIVQVVRNVLRLAEFKGERNPFTSVPMHQVDTTNREPLTEDEIRRVCRTATGELRTLLGLGAYTGLRLGSCATLRWEKIDFDRQLILERASKNSKLPVIPMHPELRRLLEEVPPEQRQGFVIPGLAERYQKRGPNSLSSLVGAHFRRQKLKTTGDKPADGKLATRLRGFHSLRSSVASMAVRAGASAEQVAQVLGDTTQVTREHYINVGVEAGRKVIEALPSGLLTEATEERDNAAPATRATVPTEDEAQKLLGILHGMTADNWEECRARAMAILVHQTEPSQCSKRTENT